MDEHLMPGDVVQHADGSLWMVSYRLISTGTDGTMSINPHLVPVPPGTAPGSVEMAEFRRETLARFGWLPVLS